jgi:hypothetical protein
VSGAPGVPPDTPASRTHAGRSPAEGDQGLNDVNSAARSILDRLEARTPPARRLDRGVAWTGPTGQHLRALMELYYAIEALRTNQDAFAVQFLDVDSGSGVGTMAHGYASVAAACRGEPVLLVQNVSDGSDRALTAAPSLLDCSRDDRPLSAAFVQSPEQPGLWQAKLTASHSILLDLDTAAIRPFLQTLGRTHPVVVLSSPPLDGLPAGAGWSRFCDGTILVVTAGKTSTAAIAAARLEIERAGGQIVGVAMNGGQTELPRWLRRWF